MPRIPMGNFALHRFTNISAEWMPARNRVDSGSPVIEQAGRALLVGCFGDAGCSPVGSRAVARARRWPPVGMAACSNSASLACRLAAPVAGFMHLCNDRRNRRRGLKALRAIEEIIQGRLD